MITYHKNKLSAGNHLLLCIKLSIFIAILLTYCTSAHFKCNPAGNFKKISAIQLVKITYNKKEFIFKGHIELCNSYFFIKAENEFGISVFNVLWNGNKLEIKPYLKIPEGMIPFDINIVAADIWRILSEWDHGDIKVLKRIKPKIVNEDSVLIKKISEELVLKEIIRKKNILTEILYSPSQGAGKDCLSRICFISFKNNLNGYEISILHKPI